MTDTATAPVEPRGTARSLGEILWADHRLVLQVLLLFFVCAAGYFWWLGWEHWQFRAWYPVLAFLALSGSAVRLLLARLSRDSRVWSSSSIAGAVLVLMLLSPFQSTFNSLKQTLDDVHGFTWDVPLADADRWLHGGRHPWQWLTPLIEDPVAVWWLDRLYIAWFPLMLAFLIWVAWMPDRVLRQRALTATLLTWIVGGVLTAFVFPSAGPCYFGRVTGLPDPFSPLMATVQSHENDMFLFTTFNQRGVWAAAERQVWLVFGGISAMPSVHVGMAVTMALAAWAWHRAFGVVAWLYAVVVQVGSVALGWHYALDGYVAAILAVVLWMSAVPVPAATVASGGRQPSSP